MEKGSKKGEEFNVCCEQGSVKYFEEQLPCSKRGLLKYFGEWLKDTDDEGEIRNEEPSNMQRKIDFCEHYHPSYFQENGRYSPFRDGNGNFIGWEELMEKFNEDDVNICCKQGFLKYYDELKQLVV